VQEELDTVALQGVKSNADILKKKKKVRKQETTIAKSTI